MYLSKSPTLLRILTRKNLVWSIPEAKKEIFLTFDDGPVPEITPGVLSILSQYGAKATFFCVGDNVRKNPGVYQQVLDAGHATGNHTFSHLNGWKTPLPEYLGDIENCSNYVKSSLFRPPYGRIRPSYIPYLRKDYRIIMWSVITGDFDREASPEKILDNALRFTTGGSIVVFHDSLKAADRMFYALPRFLETFSNKGFTFPVLPGS
ncbi:MAG: polysaccharide deacetylase family protein [Lentimicrobium sp.]|uniref:polysaccharide deacetylase family protein n=1 Tax=Lentimicrobium sp. TaxID=2034841 RepID=UPI0025D61B0F|nr:polysaccharide deacetylase family protein [Lentimicrobium sp.]MCO5255843.1 polysaccharide deacetylase family protein [Lentimicrobium sp.]